MKGSYHFIACTFENVYHVDNVDNIKNQFNALCRGIFTIVHVLFLFSYLPNYVY